MLSIQIQPLARPLKPPASTSQMTDFLSCLSLEIMSTKKPNQSLELGFKYSTLLTKLREYGILEEIITTALMSFCQSTKQSNLQELVDQWKEYNQRFRTLSTVFSYYNKIVKSIGEIALEIWKRVVLEKIRDDVKALLLESIHHWRENDFQGDLENVKMVLEMYNILDWYFSIETFIIQETISYYTIKAESHLSTQDISQYMNWVKKVFENEIGMAENVMVGPTKKKINETLEKVLVLDKVPTLTTGFTGLANSLDTNSLKLMYGLLDQVYQLDHLKTAYSNWIIEVGSKVVMNPETDSTMIPSLLKLLTDLDSITTIAFDSKFSIIQKEAFSSFLNKRHSKPAELLANYIDRLMKKASSDEEVERSLDHCLTIFRLVQGKDIFEAFYIKLLAKRLLLSKSASVDLEKQFLVRLEGECGAESEFTKKIRGMFKDMDFSRTLYEGFQKLPRFMDQIQDLEFNVLVLTSAHWPTYPTVELNLPASMVKCQNVWKDYYTAQHSGRKLSWALSLAHCAVKYRHSNGDKDLILSLYQTLCLLLFNVTDTLTTQEIQAQTNMDFSDLERTLQSLSLGKIKILKKNPHSKQVSPSDSFSINKDFSHPQRRIVVNSIQATETPKEAQETTERVFEDRVFAVDACIVRLMKSKKKMTFKALVGDVFETLKFPMEMSDLKKRIESLVERDYMERDEKDPNLFLYVA